MVIVRVLEAAYRAWPLRSHCKGPGRHVVACGIASFFGVPHAGCWDKVPMPPPPRRWGD